MNTIKNKPWWPLPGGYKNFANTLLKALNFIDQKNPSKNDLAQWFMNNYALVQSKQNASSYVTNVIGNCGMIIYQNKKYSLNVIGKEFISNKNNDYLFDVIFNNVIGFEEIIESILTNKFTLDEIRKDVSVKVKNKYDSNWTSQHPIKYRLDWLRGLEYIDYKKGNYALTQKAINYMKSVSQNISVINNKSQKPEKIVDYIEQKVEIVTPQDIKIKIDQNNFNLNGICNDLKSNEHNSDEPEKFELVISDAFNYLGFEAEHLGAPGETDVLVHANLGKLSYSLVVDGKTTKHEKIIERQISWETVKEHRLENSANYIIIVGVDFAGGDLIHRAIQNNILLLTTDTLIDLLKLHSNTPFSLLDYIEIFTEPGIISESKLNYLKQKSQDYHRELELIPTLLNAIQKMEKQHLKKESYVPLNITALYYELDKKYSMDEIKKSINWLKLFDVVKETESQDYLLIMSLQTVLLKLQILCDKFKINN
jgi:hypothetical protein